MANISITSLMIHSLLFHSWKQYCDVCEILEKMTFIWRMNDADTGGYRIVNADSSKYNLYKFLNNHSIFLFQYSLLDLTLQDANIGNMKHPFTRVR